MTVGAPRRAALGACSAAAMLALAACGQSGQDAKQPGIGSKGGDSQTAKALGFPGFATKNTTRVGGGDPTADAAGVAQAVFSGSLASARPSAISLVDASDWQGGVAAAVFMSKPVHGPILLTGGASLPSASHDALTALKPSGTPKLGGAQVIRVGGAANPAGLRSVTAAGANPFAEAAAVDRLQTRAAGRSSDRVIVASGERAEFAMPAAGWAAKSGDPVLYVTRDTIPPETRQALTLHQQPKIYLLGPPDVISPRTELALRKLGTVKRIAGPDAVTNAIAFARYGDGTFGWNVVDPGHGLVIASASRPLDAAAAAPLSASGTYGPLLLVAQAGALPQPLVQYLLDIEPGYERDPVRGVYNHAWLIGDKTALSIADQARIDTLLEIAPVTAPASTPRIPQASPSAPAAPKPGKRPTRTHKPSRP